MGISHFSISAPDNRHSQEPCVITVFVFLSHLNTLPWHLQLGGVKIIWIGVLCALTQRPLQGLLSYFTMFLSALSGLGSASQGPPLCLAVSFSPVSLQPSSVFYILVISVRLLVVSHQPIVSVNLNFCMISLHFPVKMLVQHVAPQ